MPDKPSRKVTPDMMQRGAFLTLGHISPIYDDDNNDMDSGCYMLNLYTNPITEPTGTKITNGPFRKK